MTAADTKYPILLSIPANCCQQGLFGNVGEDAELKNINLTDVNIVTWALIMSAHWQHIMRVRLKTAV